ncbi:ethanolamine permease [Portibacter marinus]|uniref:ethanolamine permease n=1 Tax=Portibacter marinus TaxID=2898660 RepID=UPI001F3D2CC8|nr:ethanolamine permease [Portibacter marinus]
MTNQLKKTLGPVMLWGLGVGYVISGMYFGWNLGLEKGGTLGLAVATGFIILMYLSFTFSYTELACAIPKAGGAFDYAIRALGPKWGFIGGMAQNIEFIFAPPAIAFAIGAYINLFLPSIPIIWIAIVIYLIFTFINIRGVKFAASFELIITIIAVIELLIFAGAAAPSFEWENMTQNALPHGWGGAFAAIPFAIWFFLAIEGVANVAEETINPQRNILIGFGSAILTLVVLCLLTFSTSVGVAGWEAIVYETPGAAASDSPLPLALKRIYGESHLLFKLVTSIGIFGLVASFHGIILAAGRATFEFGRVGFAPKAIGRVHSKYRTPANALMVNTLIGIIALFTGKTGDIITIACFGALGLYIISMVSMIILRRKEPHLERPFKVPFYPWTPILALVIASISLIAITIYNPYHALVFAGIMIAGYLVFMGTKRGSI